MSLFDQTEVSFVISHGITKTSLFSSSAKVAVIRVQDFIHASVMRVHDEIPAMISFLIGKLYIQTSHMIGKIDNIAQSDFMISSKSCLFRYG